MREMTSIERMGNILKRQPVDRIGLYEHFWGDTRQAWQESGHIEEDENLPDNFGFDLEECWAFNVTADIEMEPEVVEETEETVLVRDGNGALLRRHKLHNATPEHVDFLVRGRAQWEEHIKPLLNPDRARIKFEQYREVKEHARQEERFFVWSGVNVFEILKDVTGHQYMLMGMIDDPEWILDMAMTYARLTVQLQEILFAEEGWPDGIWFYEDMGFKGKPFMSPRMYKNLIQPAHKHTIDFVKSHDMAVIMHSCGYIEPLLSGMVEAGIDCLQVIEVKAGMDLLKLYREYGERLSFMGGIDVRALYSNDRDIIETEVAGKIPTVKGQYGYALHSDHSIPNTVDYDSYRYFVQRGLELGTYSD